MSGKTTVILVFATFIYCTALSDSNKVRKFPDGFKFGAASASYQVEGAWDEDGKSESIWDHASHKVPSPIVDGSTGDVADDSYHLYKRDVEMARELRLDFYRFSLSWTRILPTSFPDQINEGGVEYYNNLIDELLKYNIEPMVTLFHWDLPQKLQEMGGWSNPNIVDWYGDYVRVVFELFGDRVKYWITVNEPQILCYFGYGNGQFAPLIALSGMADYMCTKNVLLAHARAYHIYDEIYRSSQGGVIFISLSAQWYEAEDDKYRSIEQEANLVQWGQYAYPIFSETGDFPPIMKDRIAAKSSEQGFFRSRLPEFTAEEIEYIKGSSDYFGLNHYSTYLFYRNESSIHYYASPSYEDDFGIITYQKAEWSNGINGTTNNNMVKTVPWGFYELLINIKETYNNPTVIITENGFATTTGLDDDNRVDYYRRYLDAMLDAIDDGCRIEGYTAWSLLDNFEWSQGYTQRFGLYEVDYSSPERTRTPRKSAFVYKQILRSRELDFEYEPDSSTISIDEGH